MKKIFTIFLSILALSTIIKAQTKTITGNIIDASTKESILGVTVYVKSTTIGTITDFDGNYSINVPDDMDTIMFSFVGMTTKMEIIGARRIINVQLQPEAKQIDEVVVTAMGIKKEKKALGYASQEVKGEQIVQSGQQDISKALQGKIAGVSVKQTSGMPGAGAQVTIRGNNSLILNNQPLYVVDGMPIESGSGGSRTTESSSRTLDINPDDIESINVLKGPAAAALYGLRASNGVVVITTKSGSAAKKSGRKTIVTFNAGYTADVISRKPKLQKTYTQGINDTLDLYSPYSWGPRIDSLKPYQSQEEFYNSGSSSIYDFPINGSATNDPAFFDNVSNFFNTGNTFKNSVEVSTASDVGSYSLGFGSVNQSGIIPTTGLEKYNGKFNGLFDITDKLKLGTSMNYSSIHVDKVPGGNSTANPLFSVYSSPGSYDLTNKPFEYPGNEYIQQHYRTTMDNPYWALEHNQFFENTKRFFGNVNASYDVTSWLSLSYRMGIDNYNYLNSEIISMGSGFGRAYPQLASLGYATEPSGGSISKLYNNYNGLNSTFLATITKDLSKDINMNLILGNEFYDQKSELAEVVGNDINVAGGENIGITSNQLAYQAMTHKRGFAYFTTATFDYKGMLFFSPGGRADVVSNMPSGSRTFFYPSASTGFIFTKLSALQDNPILSYGKARLSFAQVGQAGDIYATKTVYKRSILESGSLSTYYTFPFANNNGFTLDNVLYSSNLKPQNTKTFEVGLETRFFNNRIGIDYTFYNTEAEDQIYRVPLAPSTGYEYEYRNAGALQTIGHEIIIEIKPIKTDDFEWSFISNFSTFNNNVKALAEGVNRIKVGERNFETVGTFAYEGYEYPVIFGSSYVRDGEGNIVVDSRDSLNGELNPAYGMPLIGGQTVLAEVNPDFEMSFINTIVYKKLTVSIQADWRKGGYMHSGLNSLLNAYGMSQATEDRATPTILEGSKGYLDANGNLVVDGKNDISIYKDKYYYDVVRWNITEADLHKTTFFRLREINVNYSLPMKWFKNSIIRNFDVYLSARNVFLITDFPNFDPESSTSTGNGTGGFEFVSLPNTRSFGGGIKLIF